MQISKLRKALEDVSRLFEASGLKSQAKGVSGAAALLEGASAGSVKDFVAQTAQALANSTGLGSLPSEEIARILRAADENRQAFDQILIGLRSKDCSSAQVIEVARLYAGSNTAELKSKPKAIKAIQDKYRERAFQASKSRLNQGVTPF